MLKSILDGAASYYEFRFGHIKEWSGSSEDPAAKLCKRQSVCDKTHALI